MLILTFVQITFQQFQNTIFDKKIASMHNCLLVLSNVYNFIECQYPPPVTTSLHLLSEFNLIQSLLNSLIEIDQNPKDIFQQLQVLLGQAERALGPKKFRQLVHDISTITLQYVIFKINKGQTDKGVLCLTYFQRNCQRHLTPFLQILILLTFSLAQLSKATPRTMKTYLLQSHNILQKQQKQSKKDPNLQDVSLLHNFFRGIYHLQLNNLSKSKSIFNEMISTLTARIHQQQLKNKYMQQLTVTFFVLSTHFLGITYRVIGELDVSNYNITQAILFAREHLENSQALVRDFQGQMQTQVRTVKLSRIQNKIQRIKSLHFSNNLPLPPKEPSKRNNCFIIKTHIKKESLPVKTQLQNIFTLEEPKVYTLKKRTLQTLGVESKTRQTHIQEHRLEIKTFHNQKEEIDHKYQLEERQKLLLKTEKEKKGLKSQINRQIWPVVATLKPTQKLQNYFLTFKTVLSYESSNKFYRFLCNNVGLMGHLAFFKFAKRFKSKLQRQLIKVVYIKGLKHQLQFFIHKVNKTHHIKVYFVESGPGVDDMLEVTPQIYQKLHYQPVEYHFSIKQGKLQPLDTFLQNLQLKVLCQVKLFIAKLKIKLHKKKGLISFSKREVFVTFDQRAQDLSYFIFITTTKIQKQLYCHHIQRIDLQNHQNKDYDLNINKKIITSSSILAQIQLEQIINQYILQSKQKHIKLITKIQSIFRLKLSTKELIKRRNDTTITSYKIKDNLFTLVLRGFNKYFFIEHLLKKHKSVILKNVDFSSLVFINKLRQGLEKTQNCQEQYQLIQKYFKIRQIYRKLTKRSKELQLEDNFSTKFKISLCFAIKSKYITYKSKRVETDAIFTLTVQDFQKYPRTYLLRIFNIESQSLYYFDIELKIHMAQKLFLQSNLDRIYQNVDILGHKIAHIMIDGPARSLPKNKRTNSKSTILSNYSFNSGQDYVKQIPRQRMATRLQSRESCNFARNKKNSIHFKSRHKSALKQKDVLQIKKWIQECRDNFNVSEVSEASNWD